MFEWFIFTIDKIDLLLSNVNLDNPKSVNLIFPSLEIRRLSGLRSLKLRFEKELYKNSWMQTGDLSDRP